MICAGLFASDTFRVIRSGTLVKTELPQITSTYLAYTPEAITAGTSVLSPNALISAGTISVIVTSAGANNFVVLPSPIVGQKIDIIVPSTGCEIRPLLQTQFINATECTASKELAVPAGSIMRANAVVAGTAGKWIISQLDDDGTTDAGGTPD